MVTVESAVILTEFIFKSPEPRKSDTVPVQTVEASLFKTPKETAIPELPANASGILFETAVPSVESAKAGIDKGNCIRAENVESYMFKRPEGLIEPKSTKRVTALQAAFWASTDLNIFDFLN